VENGSKLGLAIPQFNGERKKWFEWKELVRIKIKLFPSFKKVFHDEAEALKNMELSDVLYSVFEERTRGGAAQTLVESASLKTGYHAFKAIQDAMEGDETVDRIKKEAKKLKAVAKKDVDKSVLEFRGDCQKYFTVADRIEQIEGRTALTEEVKIKHILHSNLDPMWVETMLRIKDKVEDGRIKTSEDVFSALSKTKTYFATTSHDDDSKQVSTVRKTNGQQDSGQNEKKSVRFDEGKPDKSKYSDIILPSGLYETFTPEQQVWALEWSRTLKRTGDPQAAAKVTKPSNESVENHKKRRGK
jgi:hypothetical protein